MHTIQTDISDDALVTAIRATMCDFFRHVSISNPVEYLENERFTRWYTPLPHPWFNGVVCSTMPADGDAAFIDETINYFKSKKVDSFTWWMDPHLKRSDWEPLLSQSGFGFSDGTPGMAVDLDTLDESMQKTKGLEIRAVEDEESMRTWAHIFTAGYGLPLDWEKVICDTWLTLGLDFPIKNYLGYFDDEPVSTSTIFLGGGVAGIYDVATLPEMRGKGLGAALTLHPLLEARKAGYQIGVLQSSEMGFSVYKKLGFRHLCQIENFYLSLH